MSFLMSIIGAVNPLNYKPIEQFFLKAPRYTRSPLEFNNYVGNEPPSSSTKLTDERVGILDECEVVKLPPFIKRTEQELRTLRQKREMEYEIRLFTLRMREQEEVDSKDFNSFENLKKYINANGWFIKTLRLETFDLNEDQLQSLLKLTPNITLLTIKKYGKTIDIQIPLKNSVNQLNKSGLTPLIVAAQEGLSGVVKLLLERSADVDMVDNNGNGPLHWAACRGHVKVIELLLEAKANVNLLNKKGLTPLMVSVKNERLNAFQILLDANSHIDPKFELGNIISYLKIVRLKNWNEKYTLLKERKKSVNLDEFNYAKQFISVKLFAHVFEIDEPFEVAGTKISGKSFRPELIGARIAKCIKKFGDEFPDLLDQKSSEEISQSLLLAANHNSLTADMYLDRIKRGEPTFIFTGYNKHAVVVMIWKDHFVICNRGAENSDKHTVKIGRINLSKLDRDSIQELLSLSNKSKEDYHVAMNNGDKSTLLAKLEFTTGKDENSLEKMVNLPMQKIGNCSWANLEAAVRSYLLFKLKEKSNTSRTNFYFLKMNLNKLYYSWMLYQKVNIIEKYIKSGFDPHDIHSKAWNSLNDNLYKVSEKFGSCMLNKLESCVIEEPRSETESDLTV